MATSDFIGSTGLSGYTTPTTLAWSTNVNFDERDGFDLIWRQEYLQEQIAGIEDDIRAIEANANLSDTEKMYSMQMAMNTWSAVTNLRTNIMKSVSDTLKTIVRNVA